MSQNPEATPTRSEIVARSVSRHVEPILLGAGVLIGALVTIIAQLVR